MFRLNHMNLKGERYERRERCIGKYYLGVCLEALGLNTLRFNRFWDD